MPYETTFSLFSFSRTPPLGTTPFSDTSGTVQASCPLYGEAMPISQCWCEAGPAKGCGELTAHTMTTAV